MTLQAQPVAAPPDPDTTDPAAPSRAEGAARRFPGGSVSVAVAFGILIGLLMVGPVATPFLIPTIRGAPQPAFTAFLVAFGAIVSVVASGLIHAVLAFSLPGYRHKREMWERRGRAFLAIVIALAISSISPFAVLIVFTAPALAIGYFLWEQRYRPRHEAWWVFRKQDLVRVLGGCDEVGLQLATDRPEDSALSSWVRQAIPWIGCAVAISIVTVLDSAEHLSVGAPIALPLLALWLSQTIIAAITDTIRRPGARFSESQVDILAPTGGAWDTGVCVEGLTVTDATGHKLLAVTKLAMAPGTILDTRGGAASGKSLLLKALADPFGIEGLQVRGAALVNGLPLWDRRPEAGPLLCALVAKTPVLLPASGLINLCADGDAAFQARGLKLLTRMVQSGSIAQAILNTPNARHLSSGHARALALARAVLLSPSLLLLDCPEENLDDSQVATLAELLLQESRLGRSIIMVTAHRRLRELATEIASMEGGRVLEVGNADMMSASLAAGWSRLSDLRSLNSLEALSFWIHSQFRRPGDDANRRNVARVAGDLLAFSCQTADPQAPGDIGFSFKHFKGHCVLVMRDRDSAVSNAVLLQAKSLINQNGRASSTPLAAVLRNSELVELSEEYGERILTATIKVSDAREMQHLAAAE